MGKAMMQLAAEAETSGRTIRAPRQSDAQIIGCHQDETGDGFRKPCGVWRRARIPTKSTRNGDLLSAEDPVRGKQEGRKSAARKPADGTLYDL